MNKKCFLVIFTAVGHALRPILYSSFQWKRCRKVSTLCNSLYSYKTYMYFSLLIRCHVIIFIVHESHEIPLRVALSGCFSSGEREHHVRTAVSSFFVASFGNERRCPRWRGSMVSWAAIRAPRTHASLSCKISPHHGIKTWNAWFIYIILITGLA